MPTFNHVACIPVHSPLDSVIDKQNPCAVGRLNIFAITMNTNQHTLSLYILLMSLGSSHVIEKHNF